jgi:hypothetical protein
MVKLNMFVYKYSLKYVFILPYSFQFSFLLFRWTDSKFPDDIESKWCPWQVVHYSIILSVMLSRSARLSCGLRRSKQTSWSNMLLAFHSLSFFITTVLSLNNFIRTYNASFCVDISNLLWNKMFNTRKLLSNSTHVPLWSSICILILNHWSKNILYFK